MLIRLRNLKLYPYTDVLICLYAFPEATEKIIGYLAAIAFYPFQAFFYRFFEAEKIKRSNNNSPAAKKSSQLDKKCRMRWKNCASFAAILREENPPQFADDYKKTTPQTMNVNTPEFSKMVATAAKSRALQAKLQNKFNYLCYLFMRDLLKNPLALDSTFLTSSKYNVILLCIQRDFYWKKICLFKVSAPYLSKWHGIAIEIFMLV